MTVLPLATVKRIAEDGGAERVGMDATEALCLAAEEWIKRIAGKAQKFAKHAGRVTLKAEDIFVVVKEDGISVHLSPPKPKPVPAQAQAKKQPLPTKTVESRVQAEPVVPPTPAEALLKKSPMKPSGQQPQGTLTSDEYM